MRIGLIVNPVAGMGGSVGLKGTDGADTLAEARARGAVPLAGGRAARALAVLARTVPGTRVLTGPGPLGQEATAGLDLDVSVLEAGGQGARATRALADTLRAEGVDLIAFAGGDGTARDICGRVGLEVPMLGIPCGVKMHSGVFAVTPEAAGRLMAELARGAARTGYRRAEIMDIDEDALRAGRISARLYGYARAPHLRQFLQNAKATPPLDDEAMLEALGHEVAAEMRPGVTYLIGPGTTAKRPEAALGLDGALLGVDVVRDGRLVARDVSGAEALAAAGDGPLGLIVGVTGGQGFVFGRGNQQIGAEAIRRAWPGGVTIMASAAKLAALPRPVLHADTGDPALDAAIAGFARVRTGPRRAVMMRIA